MWHEVCDWYIELIKPVLYDDSGQGETSRRAAQATLGYVIDVSLRLLHPFVPFVTEDIWQSFEHPGDGEGEVPEAIVVTPWPLEQPLLREFEGAGAQMAGAIELISAIRTVRGETGVKPGVSIPQVTCIAPKPELRALLEATAPYLERQARIDRIVVVASPEEVGDAGASATAMAAGVEIRIPLKGLIDTAEERTRLDKEIARVEGDIAFVSGKLGNPKFVDRAPEAIVAKEREKLAGFEREREALAASLKALEALEAE